MLQSSVWDPVLGDGFHQITDFNDLPTSLFACNVDQCVFEEQEGKVRLTASLSSSQRILDMSSLCDLLPFSSAVGSHVICTVCSQPQIND